MLRALLLAAVCSLAGCSQIVNLSPVQSNPDMLSPQRADRVEVFNRTTPPDRPYSKYVRLETKTTGVPSQDAAALRAKGGAAGCDAILLSDTPGKADCVLYNGK